MLVALFMASLAAAAVLPSAGPQSHPAAQAGAGTTDALANARAERIEPAMMMPAVASCMITR